MPNNDSSENYLDGKEAGEAISRLDGRVVTVQSFAYAVGQLAGELNRVLCDDRALAKLNEMGIARTDLLLLDTLLLTLAEGFHREPKGEK
jgi:hypothetical protein